MNRKEKPLTLDEMRKMNGKPVQYEANGEIFMVELNHPDFGECVISESGYYIPLHRAVDRSVGRRFFAYERPQIDREAWEPCQYCGDYEALPEHIVNGKVIGKVFDACICEDQNGWHIELPIDPDIGIQYCPVCGRPLTDAAWKQLEERFVQK